MCVSLVRKWLRHSFIKLNDMILIFLNLQNLWLRNWRPFSNDLTVFSTNVTNWKLLNIKLDLVWNAGGSNLPKPTAFTKQKLMFWLQSYLSEVFSKTLAFARKVVTFWWINKAVSYWTLNTVCTGKGALST